MPNTQRGDDLATPETDRAALAEDRPCVRCEYNLRGLMRDGRCPECGLEVAESLKSPLLHDCGAGWLNWSRWWLYALAASGVLYLGGLLAAAGGEIWWVATPSLNPWMSGTWVLAVFFRSDRGLILGVCVLALLLRGVAAWALTKEPDRNVPISGPWLRWGIRFIVVVSAGTPVALLANRFFIVDQATMYMVLAAPDAILAWLIGMRLRSMARRVPAQRLNRLIAIAQIGTAAGVAVFVLGFLLFRMMGSDDSPIICIYVGLSAQTAFGVVSLIASLLLARELKAAWWLAA